MMRVAALLRRSSMDDCDRFYEAAGRALHEEGRKPHRPEVAEEICAALGLDPGVVRAATGQEALDLWELTVAYSSVPHLYELVPRLYELKTPKTDADMDHIAGVFRAYFEAQDWESREKTAP